MTDANRRRAVAVACLLAAVVAAPPPWSAGAGHRRRARATRPRATPQYNIPGPCVLTAARIADWGVGLHTGPTFEIVETCGSGNSGSCGQTRLYFEIWQYLGSCAAGYKRAFAGCQTLGEVACGGSADFWTSLDYSGFSPVGGVKYQMVAYLYPGSCAQGGGAYLDYAKATFVVQYIDGHPDWFGASDPCPSGGPPAVGPEDWEGLP